MTKDNIAIKLWKSLFKTKVFDVPRNSNIWHIFNGTKTMDFDELGTKSSH